MRVTHGCIRRYPDDFEYLYRHVPIGIRVHIVNEPVKVGWHAGQLYLEVHQLLYEIFGGEVDLLKKALTMIDRELDQRALMSNLLECNP